LKKAKSENHQFFGAKIQMQDFLSLKSLSVLDREIRYFYFETFGDFKTFFRTF